MAKILENLKHWIKRDGLLHIESCALIAIVSGILVPWWAAGIIALFAGGLKELWDIKHGVANWHDFICDSIGVLLSIPILLI